jgi:hypothetical protein
LTSDKRFHLNAFWSHTGRYFGTACSSLTDTKKKNPKYLMNNYGSLMGVEVILIFGGVLLFAWWQLRDIRKERDRDQKKEQNKGQD